MKPNLTLLTALMLAPLVARPADTGPSGSDPVGAVRAAAKPASPNDVVLDRVRKYVPPLAHPRGDRLPILVWQSRDFPTGLETGDVASTQKVFVDRGILPLCNPCAGIESAKTYLPILRYWQERGFPVCILPQGWVQSLVTPDKNGRSKCRHAPPADPSPKYPCPSATMALRTSGQSNTVAETLGFLRDNGVKVKFLVVDFESGLYLRNAGDREEPVRQQAAMALRCPKCVAEFGREAFEQPAAFAALADRVRSQITRTALCEPARKVFPDLAIGNFYARPINRLPRPEGRWPAYGYENSGLNVAMPSMYMNAGWRGAGRDQAKMNWNAFYCCLERFSPAASVRRPGELLIPWSHVWIGGRYLDLAMKGGMVPEPWVMAEMVRHMMLRGAETFAIWFDTLICAYPVKYPHPQYAAMGQFVYDVVGIQEGYDDMLRFQEFLRRAQAVTFAVPGAPNELTEETATWSAMKTEEKALVRTIAFAGGKTFTKAVQVYGKPVHLEFGPRGRFYWLYPDGRSEQIATDSGLTNPKH